MLAVFAPYLLIAFYATLPLLVLNVRMVIFLMLVRLHAQLALLLIVKHASIFQSVKHVLLDISRMLVWTVKYAQTLYLNACNVWMMRLVLDVLLNTIQKACHVYPVWVLYLIVWNVKVHLHAQAVNQDFIFPVWAVIPVQQWFQIVLLVVMKLTVFHVLPLTTPIILLVFHALEQSEDALTVKMVLFVNRASQIIFFCLFRENANLVTRLWVIVWNASISIFV